MKKLSLIALSICLYFVASAQFKTVSNWENFNTEFYELKYPSDWTFQLPESSMLDFVVLCPLESEKDKLRENFNIVREGAQGLSLDAYAASSAQMLKLAFQKFKILSTNDILRDDIPMKHITYTAKFGEENLYFSQLYSISNNVVYILTFTSEKKKQKAYSKIEKEILDSFKLISK